MKALRVYSTLGLLSFVSALATFAADARVYELRTYTATRGNLDKLLARFRDHTLKIFEKHGITHVGYWVPMEAKDGAGEKFVYLRKGVTPSR